MPPKTRRMPRCSYREGKQRCSRSGVGNPPLCHPHRVLVEHELRRSDRGGSPIAEVMGDFLRGERVSTEDLLSALFGVFGGQARSHGYVDNEPVRGMPHAQARQAPRPRPHAPPPSPDPLADRRRALGVLGFAPTDDPTLEQIQKRYREFARRHHPDRQGGSTAKMAQINDARDVLVS